MGRRPSRPPSVAASMSLDWPTDVLLIAVEPPKFTPAGECRSGSPARIDPVSDQNRAGERDRRSEMIFLGTGTSEGVPRVSCLTREPVTCPVCPTAVKPGSNNRRRNTSVLIKYSHPDGRTRNLVIDTGKFFWHSAIEWFPKYRVPNIVCRLLLHDHADA